MKKVIDVLDNANSKVEDNNVPFLKNLNHYISIMSYQELYKMSQGSSHKYKLSEKVIDFYHFNSSNLNFQ